MPAGIRVITAVAVTTVWQTHFGTGFGGAGMGVVYPGISAQLEYIPNDEQKVSADALTGALSENPRTAAASRATSFIFRITFLS